MTKINEDHVAGGLAALEVVGNDFGRHVRRVAVISGFLFNLFMCVMLALITFAGTFIFDNAPDWNLMVGLMFAFLGIGVVTGDFIGRIVLAGFVKEVNETAKALKKGHEKDPQTVAPETQV